MYRTPDYDNYCNKCSLTTGKAVHSYCTKPFKEALLLIVSDYPSNLEESSNIPLTPSKDGCNGGKLLQVIINKVFDEDTLFPSTYKPFMDYVVLSNAIRCNPSKGKEIKDISYKNISQCKTWLNIDISNLNPYTPILLSGSKAVSSILGKNEKVIKNKRKLHHLDTHPLLVVENFAQPARYVRRKVTNTYQRRKDGILMPSKKGIEILSPTLLDPVWSLNQDFILLKELVIKYINKYK